MREPGFWWEKPGVLARLLWPFSFVYGAIALRRMRQPGAMAGIPVICVGNFTLGGTGKTPAAIAIAKLLIEGGEKPFFLSRGYGGRLAGPVRVEPVSHRAADIGDEPLLLARHAPAIVSHDRTAGAALAQRSGATVIVMDDGLQNPSLSKDIAIAVVDARRGFGNAQVFPAGPLRAPLRPQFESVKAILLIGKGAGANHVSALARENGCAILHGRLEPSADAIKALTRRKVFAFAGIGDPEKFFMTLASAGIEAQIEESFADHHPYTEADAARILTRCETDKLTPVTTEKDMMRLAGATGSAAKLAASTKTIPVTLVVEEADLLRKLFRQTLAARRA